MPDISDGELVLLARDGDQMAFRLLVERHQFMVRARARQLCANPSDTDDVMQETFLRAFIALDRLRDPDRFAAWLAGITANVSDSHWHDYQCVAEGGTAVIASAVPEPTGFAMLGQEVYADDYRGSTVVLRGEFRVPEGRAGLFLRVNQGRPIRGPLTEQAAFADPDNNVTPVANDPGWVPHQISAWVPADGDAVVFGIFLAGPGRIELRNPELLRVTS